MGWGRGTLGSGAALSGVDGLASSPGCATVSPDGVAPSEIDGGFASVAAVETGSDPGPLDPAPLCGAAPDAVAVRVRASSARSIVYDRNGGSPEEPTAPGCAVEVERTGPVSNSGTNRTMSATRIIAPVSRSFTEPLTLGREIANSRSVYPKPLQRRADSLDGTEHQHPIRRSRRGTRCLAARCNRVG